MKKTKNILLVQDKSLYFYEAEEACVQPIKMKGINLYVRKACEIFNLKIPRYFLNQELFDGKMIIFTDSAFHIGTVKTCFEFYDSQYCYLYYLNTINENNIKFCKYFKKENIYTFDHMDAQKYNIKFKHTPYSDKIILPQSKIEYDALFLGREKGMKDKIYEIYHTLKNLGLRVKFLVLGSSDKDFKLEQFLNYQDYLSMCAKSKSIVEINKIGQSGCSLRMLESLFFKKKLITTNLDIYKDNYYNCNNIFIWGTDNNSKIIDFINSPYIANMDLTQLIFQNWINEF